MRAYKFATVSQLVKLLYTIHWTITQLLWHTELYIISLVLTNSGVITWFWRDHTTCHMIEWTYNVSPIPNHFTFKKICPSICTMYTYKYTLRSDQHPQKEQTVWPNGLAFACICNVWSGTTSQQWTRLLVPKGPSFGGSVVPKKVLHTCQYLVHTAS